MQTLHCLLGLGALLSIAWLASENRRRVPWRIVLTGVALAFVFAVLLLRVPPVAGAFARLNALVETLDRATEAGTRFVFGYLGGGALPFAETKPGASFVLAFRALPIVLPVAALSALLFHWRLLPVVVRGIAWVLRRSMGLGGAVGLSAAANVFVGMVEAPLVVKPYLARLSRGELFIVMNCGMATIAGTVLVLYATVLTPIVPNALTHLLIASVVATPLAIVIAALMVPPEHTDDAHVPIERQDPGAMAALTRGTFEGLQLLLNIVAMLIVFVALVAFVNSLLGTLPDVQGAPLTLERIFGWLFAPLAWACGIPWTEAQTAGHLLGKKTVLNEMVAYFDLVALPPEALSTRSRLLMTYALCGFANFGSLGIMLGGMAALLPEARRAELAQLGLKSVAGGLLATCATAALVGAVL
ncbi:MAG: nucleoside transporter C-terminal domain-containing protein [Burkholderiaceae bacterium]